MESLIEKKLLISIIGTLDTLKAGGISIEEAEKYLFSPHMIKILKENDCSESIVEILEKACELEDVNSLIPQRFIDIIEEIKLEAIGVIKEYPTYEYNFWL